jgi:SAM-dependent methyltransferase
MMTELTQQQISQINELAWNGHAYEAWVARFGPPEQAAAQITRNPAARLKGLLPYLGPIEGRKVINLLGSHGSKAVALAILGARDVTVADISESNARYARSLADAAGVHLRYIVSDVLELPESELSGDYDILFMEFGILHYFIDLAPLMGNVARLLQTGGRFVLQDFHPVSTKLISSKGTTAKIRKHKVTGDYFDTSLEEVEVAYSKFVPEGQAVDLPKVRLRRWTLGEIITAVAGAGLFIERLEEEANQSSDVFDKGIPKTFTLVAVKK